MAELAGRARKIFDLVTRPFRWIAGLETSGKFSGSLALTDLILCSLAVMLYGGFGLDRAIDLDSALLIGAAVMVVNLLGLVYLRIPSSLLSWRWLHLLAVNALAALIVPLSFHWLEIGLDRRALIFVLLILAPVQLAFHFAHARRRATTPLESLRWALLAAGSFAIGYPFLTNATVGTGDAYWYANMVADFTTQWRTGIFPVFIGQSDFAFNGAVNPLRYAPYLQHAAGVLDVLTRHRLSFFGLVNLTLFSSLVAGAFTTYFALNAIVRELRWMTFLLALLWITSPAVLSLAYTGDLFMSVCTLPYLPLVMLGLYRTFRDRDTASVCFVAAALAAVWLCHPPIAFWVSVVVAVGQLFRLGREARDPQLWRSWLAGAGVFVALTAFAFISVATLKLPVAIVERSLSIEVLRQVYPGIFLPVSENAAALSDYQLGLSLWWVWLFGAIGALVQRRMFHLTLLLGTVYFLLLLLPIPHVLHAMWYALPQAVCNLTNNWPMQRLYVLIAIMAIFAGYVSGADWALRRRLVRWILTGGLAMALWWSESEAIFFLHRGVTNTAGIATAQTSHLPQNRVLTRYAFGSFVDLPSYYSHGYIDPVWENRLLAPDSLQEITSNYRALTSDAAATVYTEGKLVARQQGNTPFYEIFTALPIEPQRRYALEMTIAPEDLNGSLLFAGTTVNREYYLPDSGVGVTSGRPPTSFGTLPTSKHSLPLFSTAATTEKLLVQFVSSAPVTKDISDFGHYTLREYDVSRLPVHVETWAPYRANVTSPARAWLETPRIFVDGYRAIVNGKDVSVARSPNNLVMFLVEAGKSRVKLTHPGPISLRLAYYLSLSAWIAVGGLAGWRAIKRNGSAPPA